MIGVGLNCRSRRDTHHAEGAGWDGRVGGGDGLRIDGGGLDCDHAAHGKSRTPEWHRR